MKELSDRDTFTRIEARNLFLPVAGGGGGRNFCESLDIARNKRRLIIHSRDGRRRPSSVTLINCDHRLFVGTPSHSETLSRFPVERRIRRISARASICESGRNKRTPVAPSWIISTLKMKVVRRYLPAGLINPSLSSLPTPRRTYILPRQPTPRAIIERWHDRCDPPLHPRPLDPSTSRGSQFRLYRNFIGPFSLAERE